MASALPTPGQASSTSESKLDRDSVEWLHGLRTSGRRRTEAQARLHALLLQIAHREVNRRRGQLPIAGPELDDLAHQAAADALMAIVAKLNDFRGESRFATWVYRFVILEVSTKLGRHFWRRPNVTLDNEDWERLPDRLGLDPARQSEWHELMDALHRAVEEVLTDHQRRIFVAVVLNGVPADALAAKLNTNRNAIYKTMFDARRKIRAALIANGHLEPQISRHQ